MKTKIASIQDIASILPDNATGQKPVGIAARLLTEVELTHVAGGGFHSQTGSGSFAQQIGGGNYVQTGGSYDQGRFGNYAQSGGSYKQARNIAEEYTSA
ncbi:hypothetical protein [Brevundimonas nasdae]|uniref:hypothetical protein n=1 Tax=Brevundimonas nasdae TaxID=172043 RepID=UPI003F68D321